MGEIILTEEQYSNLQPYKDINGKELKGKSGKIVLCPEIEDIDYNNLVLKIYRDDYVRYEETRYIMGNKYHSLFSKLIDKEIVVFPLDYVSLLTRYGFKMFIGVSMRKLRNVYEAYDDFFDINSPNYCNLDFLINVIKRSQKGLKEEAHPQGVFARDFYSKNIAISDGLSYLIDTDGWYGIKKMHFKNREKNEIRENVLDLYMLMIMFITKIEPEDKENKEALLETFTKNYTNNLSLAMQNYFKDLSSSKSIEYIEESVLDEIGRNYIMIPNTLENRGNSKFIFEKK